MAIRFPGPVPAAALRFLRHKQLRPAFSHLDVWREEHGYAFTVAKATQVDVLQSIKDELEQALAEGRTLRQFQQELEPTLRRLGWWGEQPMVDPATGLKDVVQLGSPRRLRTIYRTNLRTARAAGQWDRIERTKSALPYLEYNLGPSEEHREEHEKWAARVRLLPVDDPWWQTHMPPNGWGCKCWVRQVSRAEAERRGVAVSSAPAVQQQRWVNRRTGAVEMVPKGIDPGFDHNPGLVRQQNMERMMAGKLAGVDPGLAEVARRDLGAYRQGAGR